MAEHGVEQLLYLMDRAFDSPGNAHAVLSNLEDVRDEDWTQAPPGGGRTIAMLSEHVGECKRMYANHAFEDEKLSWHDFDSRNVVLPDKASMIEWLRESQANLRRHVEALDDEQLTVPRKANWGKMYETRWLIGTMIEHDLYHAGEINHIRALLQGNDAVELYGT